MIAGEARPLAPMVSLTLGPYTHVWTHRDARREPHFFEAWSIERGTLIDFRYWFRDAGSGGRAALERIGIPGGLLDSAASSEPQGIALLVRG